MGQKPGYYPFGKTPELMDPYGTYDSLWTADHQIAAYDSWWCAISYFLDAGMLQIPVSAPNSIPPTAAPQVGGNPNLAMASPSVPGQNKTPLLVPLPSNAQQPARTPCVVAQVAAPYGYRVVEFAAERTSDWPKVPHPLVNDPNLFLAGSAVCINPPSLDPNGQTHGFRVSGWHAHILQVPYWLLDNLMAGLTAYDMSGVQMNPSGPVGPWYFPPVAYNLPDPAYPDFNPYLFYIDGAPLSPTGPLPPVPE